jgi:pyrimidine operon attenuation protein / uracil phosphoribosyltransferase
METGVARVAENFPIERVLMEADDLQRAIALLAAHLHRDFPHDPNLVLLGIKTRGVFIARRIAQQLVSAHKQNVFTGEIDITLYRDDLSTLGPQAVVGKSEVGFDVTGKSIVLVDDVLYTGRTVRAALDEIVDFGRPNLIRLMVIADRGMREYPIQAEYVAQRVETNATHMVQVRLKEVDGDDRVLLCKLTG